MLSDGIILAIYRRDALRPLGIYFRPFAYNVLDTKYHTQRCAYESSFNTGPNPTLVRNKPTKACKILGRYIRIGNFTLPNDRRCEHAPFFFFFFLLSLPPCRPSNVHHHK